MASGGGKKYAANPLATVLSAAMMFEYAFKLEEEAKMIRRAAAASLDEGVVTSRY
ncbi:MAG: isocitrate/isopropylmalate family dehydrogenase [Marinilabiliales bacterium]|nr:isocitrate/isopropylmalate family dehydrogenase [Marinilabiliales bacterium]